MRLTCPNCDAQYEVPSEVIPAEGRDVQCSNCGKTWFQAHPDAPQTEENPAETDAYAEGEERAEAPVTEGEPREMDPAVADILRAEAEQEARARAEEARAALESQPDLGLDDIAEPPQPDETPDDAARRGREARERMARLRGNKPPAPGPTEAAAAAAAIGSRKDLLPDIEEINSTLRSTGDRQHSGASAHADSDSAPVAAARQQSFRRGFALSVLIVMVLVALYAAGPRIVEAVPQAEPVISAYSAQVDAARLWLDGQVMRLLVWVNSALS